MPVHATITDLAVGFIKATAGNVLNGIKAKLISSGQTAAASAVCTILRSRTGLTLSKCEPIANIVVRKLTKEIRDKIKK